MRVLFFSLCMLLFLSCQVKKEPYFEMRGVVLSVEDLESMDWPKLAAENNINTIGTHITPEQVAAFIKSDKGKQFVDDCRKYGIAVEHQLHAMHELLPRSLFSDDSTMFRMNEEGRRIADYNCCVSSSKALDLIAKNAVHYARLLPSANHRYYYWLDDGGPLCMCPECSRYSGSEQALIVENRIIKDLKTYDPQAQLAHLAYHNTLQAPRRVKPEDGIFLEFAPFYRDWQKPLSDVNISGRGMSHEKNLRHLKENLTIFPAETAVVLEYWLDVSLFSNWKKPARKLSWNKEVFESDINTYAELGIKNITSFAVYVDSAYVNKYQDMEFLKEYGDGLKQYRKETAAATSALPVYTVPFISGEEMKTDAVKDEPAWELSLKIDSFINPWDREINPETSLSLLADDKYLYFFFEVYDDDIVMTDEYTDEMCVAKGDRVELFFTGDPEKKRYYGFEIDPLGRVLDYRVDYYRNFHYDWNYQEITTKGKIQRNGYSVEGAIPIRFLKDMIDENRELFWGAYRGEFNRESDGEIIENWMCIKDPETAEPDFHVPGSFCKLILNQ